MTRVALPQAVVLCLLCLAAQTAPAAAPPVDYFNVYGVQDGSSTGEFQTLKGLDAVDAANASNVVTVFPGTDALQVRNVYSGTRQASGSIANLRPLASIVVKGSSFYRVDLRAANPTAVQVSNEAGLLACAGPRVIPIGFRDADALSKSLLIYQGKSNSNPTLCGQFRVVPLDAGPADAPTPAPALRAGFVPLYKPSGAFLGVLQRTPITASTGSLTFVGPTLTAATSTTVLEGVKSFTVMATDEAGNTAVVVDGVMRRLKANGALASAPLRKAPADGYAIAVTDGTGRGFATTDGTTLFFTENRIVPADTGYSSRLLRVPMNGSAAAVVMTRNTSQIETIGTTPTRVVFKLGFYTGSPDFPPFDLLTLEKAATAGTSTPVRLFKVAANAGFLQTPRIVGSTVYFSTRQGVGDAAVDRAWIKADDGTLVRKFGPGSSWRFGGIINRPVPAAQMRAALQTGLYLYRGGAIETSPYDFQMLTTNGTGGRAVGGTLSLHRIADGKNFPLTTLTDTQSMANSGILGSYVLDRIVDSSVPPFTVDVVGVGTAAHTFDRITQTPGVDEGLAY